jgi:hypothetical protein
MAALNPTETLIAARRLADARPHLAAIASIVHHQDVWQLCRDELTGIDVRSDRWDIRGRWFGVVVVATPRLGGLRRGETIPWQVIAAQIAASERLELIRTAWICNCPRFTPMSREAANSTFHIDAATS